MAELPEVPDGFEPIGWYTFPSQWGPWKPSKVHLTPVGEVATRLGHPGTVCGTRRAGRAHTSRGPSDIADHVKDAGVCARCWPKAERIRKTIEKEREDG